jgi:flagellar hook-associated protein 3 FlgL
MLSLGNKEFEGVYIFAGDRSTSAPFVEENGGVKFVGSSNVLQNQFDEAMALPFMADGSAIFGALSTRVQGTADLTPSLSATTRLVDLKGATSAGVHPGAIQLSNGTTSGTIDLTSADTIGDVITHINDAGVGGITASVGADGVSIKLTAGGGDDITVTDIGGGRTAADLGIATATGAGAGVDVNGTSVAPILTALTPLADLKAGAGIDLSSGMIVKNGQSTANIDFSGAATVEDLLNKINSANVGVRAEINAAGSGINILNPTQATQLTIAENGGTTASDLGVRSFNPNTKLSELNGGKGVRTVSGDDFSITDTAGVSFNVDLGSEQTIQDVIDRINAAATSAGAGVTASFATSGNGIQLTDSAGGGGTLALTAQNFSNAAADLGIAKPAVAGSITGDDVNPVQTSGVFANIIKLRDSLKNNDQAGITAASEGLSSDLDRVTRIRGETGARVQEIDSRQQRLEDQNLATTSLLSSLQDTDFTQAVAKFQTLQTALQANLQTSGKLLNLSLLDFLQ